MKTCLIVDDSQVVRKVLRRMLENWNFEVSEASDGQEGIARCREQFPNGIILDCYMPKMDGHEFLHALRHMPGGDKPKVIFCSVENDVAHIARALKEGANEYIMKPIDRDTLKAKLEEVGLI